MRGFATFVEGKKMNFKKKTRNTRNNMYYCDDCNINYGVQSKGGKG